MRPPFSAIEPLSARRVDGDARALRQRLLAGHRRGRGGAGLRRPARGSLAAGLRLRRSGLDLLRLLAFRLHRRLMLRHEEILPGEQHADRQNDGQDEIAVVLVHVAFGSGRLQLKARAWLTWGVRRVRSRRRLALLCWGGLVHLGKRALKVLDQLGEAPLYRALPRDQNIIIAFHGAGGAASRTASFKRRRARLRRTAPPRALVAVKPKRAR